MVEKMTWRNKIAFFMGLIFGLTLGLTKYYIDYINKTTQYHLFNNPDSHEDLKDAEGPHEKVKLHDHSEPLHKNEDEVSKQLFDKVKVLCWVLTTPENHDKKAKHVYATWGKRCNKILFMSSGPHETLPIVQLNIEEGRDKLFGKTKAAFKYVYDNHIDEYDWFYKADDDTYAIMENMRYMLSIYDPTDPIYFGHKFKKHVKNGYMSGGAGYVLSREALKRFAEDSLPNKQKCNQQNFGSEDLHMGKCLMNVGVIAGDSRDEFGRKRFFPLSPGRHLIPGSLVRVNWFFEYTYYEHKEGIDGVSDTAISFHYLSPNYMYELEYFIYHLRPYGMSNEFQFPPQLPPDFSSLPKRVIEKYTREENFTL